MRVLNLVVVVSSAVLLLSGVAYADSGLKHNIHNVHNVHNVHNQSFISKRPYQQVPAESAYSKKENFEGATLIDENAETDRIHKPMRLHMLGKRPYMEKNTD